MVARDGIEPPPPAFSGLLSPNFGFDSTGVFPVATPTAGSKKFEYETYISKADMGVGI